MAIFSIKTAIFDFEDNYGHGTYLGVRQIDFFDSNGNLIEVTESTASFYATDVYSETYPISAAFLTALSRTGSDHGQGYMAAGTTEKRLIIVFNEITDVGSVGITNAHYYGGYTTSGVNNLKVYLSSEETPSRLYQDAINNYTLIFNGRINEHIASDVADVQILSYNKLSGTVKDGSTAISGATVKIFNSHNNFVDPSTTTDDAGRFIIENLSSDTYTIIAEKDGYAPQVFTGVTPVEII